MEEKSFQEPNLETNTVNKKNILELNNEYTEYMEHLKTLNLADLAPPEWLKACETPFKWSESLVPEYLFKSDLDLKLEDYANQNEAYTVEKYSLLLTLVFEKFIMKDIEKSTYYLSQLKEMLNNLSSKKTSEVYMRIGPALDHIYSASKAHLMGYENDSSKEDAKALGASLEPVSKMSPACQAGVEAIKAKFYMWCSKDSNLALRHILEACKLDPEFAPWQYWTGMILRKIRRELKEKEPTEEELKYFETAVEIERDAKHLLYLAQAYREKANFLFKAHSKEFHFYGSDVSKEVDILNKKSLDLYRECWSKNTDFAGLYRRLGNGLMNLPRYIADYAFAKEVLHKAESLSRNPVIYHILGNYYFRYEQDDEKAREYYQKAADHGLIYGFNELIRLNFLSDKNYDALEDLKKVEKAMTYSVNLDTVYCDIGWYHLFFKNDLVSALEYFWKVIQKDEESVCLIKFTSYSFYVSGAINIYNLLYNEIPNHYPESEGIKRPEIVDKFLSTVLNRPHLLTTSDITLASIKSEVAMDLRANRKRIRLNCPEFDRNDSFVGKRFPGENYDEYRQNKIKELADLLKTQRISESQDETTLNSVFKEKVVEKKTLSWRHEKGTLDNAKPSTSKPTCFQKSEKVENWRLECKAFQGEKSTAGDIVKVENNKANKNMFNSIQGRPQKPV